MSKNNKLNFFTKNDTWSDLNDVINILNTGVFSEANSSNPFVKAAFIEVIICLRDLMYKCEKFGEKRVDFNDDVIQMNLKLNGKEIIVEDVTDLISYIRNSICHPESPQHFFEDGIRGKFTITYGKGIPISINENEMISDYEDDVCFFFGKQKIYLHRHIIRAFREAETILKPLISPLAD